MRVTEQTKQETRQRILSAAKKLFASQGFEETVTRDISSEAGVAAGTLFNYFSTKEAIVISLAAAAAEAATVDFWKKRREDASLEEDIFGLIAAHLRRLRPLRKYLSPVIDAVMHPVAKVDDDSGALRISYFETLHDLLGRHDFPDGLSTAAAQLHWSLVAGVLSFWTVDKSPKQEDTLALLDQSIQMFLEWFHSN